METTVRKSWNEHLWPVIRTYYPLTVSIRIARSQMNGINFACPGSTEFSNGSSREFSCFSDADCLRFGLSIALITA
jgi:hypothetical protein